jgi:mannose-6-phosphate isomerase-like protein (cupin superfamily)
MHRSLASMEHVINPRLVAESLADLWTPRVIGEVDDAYVKVAKVQGTLTWHAHDDEDELFFVLRGSLKIEMEQQTVCLNEGEMFVVPKGVRHNPIAEDECWILLIERKSTLHTGNTVSEKTCPIEQQIKSD